MAAALDISPPPWLSLPNELVSCSRSSRCSLPRTRLDQLPSESFSSNSFSSSCTAFDYEVLISLLSLFTTSQWCSQSQPIESQCSPARSLKTLGDISSEDRDIVNSKSKNALFASLSAEQHTLHPLPLPTRFTHPNPSLLSPDWTKIKSAAAKKKKKGNNPPNKKKATYGNSGGSGGKDDKAGDEGDGGGATGDDGDKDNDDDDKRRKEKEKEDEEKAKAEEEEEEKARLKAEEEEKARQEAEEQEKAHQEAEATAAAEAEAETNAVSSAWGFLRGSVPSKKSKKSSFPAWPSLDDASRSSSPAPKPSDKINDKDGSKTANEKAEWSLVPKSPNHAEKTSRGWMHDEPSVSSGRMFTDGDAGESLLPDALETGSMVVDQEEGFVNAVPVDFDDPIEVTGAADTLPDEVLDDDSHSQAAEEMLGFENTRPDDPDVLSPPSDLSDGEDDRKTKKKKDKLLSKKQQRELEKEEKRREEEERKQKAKDEQRKEVERIVAEERAKAKEADKKAKVEAAAEKKRSEEEAGKRKAEVLLKAQKLKDKEKEKEKEKEKGEKEKELLKDRLASTKWKTSGNQKEDEDALWPLAPTKLKGATKSAADSTKSSSTKPASSILDVIRDKGSSRTSSRPGSSQAESNPWLDMDLKSDKPLDLDFNFGDKKTKLDAIVFGEIELNSKSQNLPGVGQSSKQSTSSAARPTISPDIDIDGASDKDESSDNLGTFRKTGTKPIPIGGTGTKPIDVKSSGRLNTLDRANLLSSQPSQAGSGAGSHLSQSPGSFDNPIAAVASSLFSSWWGGRKTQTPSNTGGSATEKTANAAAKVATSAPFSGLGHRWGSPNDNADTGYRGFTKLGSSDSPPEVEAKNENGLQTASASNQKEAVSISGEDVKVTPLVAASGTEKNEDEKKNIYSTFSTDLAGNPSNIPAPSPYDENCYIDEDGNMVMIVDEDDENYVAGEGDIVIDLRDGMPQFDMSDVDEGAEVETAPAEAPKVSNPTIVAEPVPVRQLESGGEVVAASDAASAAKSAKEISKPSRHETEAPATKISELKKKDEKKGASEASLLQKLTVSTKDKKSKDDKDAKREAREARRLEREKAKAEKKAKGKDKTEDLLLVDSEHTDAKKLKKTSGLIGSSGTREPEPEPGSESLPKPEPEPDVEPQSDPKAANSRPDATHSTEAHDGDTACAPPESEAVKDAAPVPDGAVVQAQGETGDGDAKIGGAEEGREGDDKLGNMPPSPDPVLTDILASPPPVPDDGDATGPVLRMEDLLTDAPGVTVSSPPPPAPSAPCGDDDRKSLEGASRELSAGHSGAKSDTFSIRQPSIKGSVRSSSSVKGNDKPKPSIRSTKDTLSREKERDKDKTKPRILSKVEPKPERPKSSDKAKVIEKSGKSTGSSSRSGGFFSSFLGGNNSASTTKAKTKPEAKKSVTKERKEERTEKTGRERPKVDRPNAMTSEAGLAEAAVADPNPDSNTFSDPSAPVPVDAIHGPDVPQHDAPVEEVSLGPSTGEAVVEVEPDGEEGAAEVETAKADETDSAEASGAVAPNPSLDLLDFDFPSVSDPVTAAPAEAEPIPALEPETEKVLKREDGDDAGTATDLGSDGADKLVAGSMDGLDYANAPGPDDLDTDLDVEPAREQTRRPSSGPKVPRIPFFFQTPFFENHVHHAAPLGTAGAANILPHSPIEAVPTGPSVHEENEEEGDSEFVDLPGDGEETVRGEGDNENDSFEPPAVGLMTAEEATVPTDGNTSVQNTDPIGLRDEAKFELDVPAEGLILDAAPAGDHDEVQNREIKSGSLLLGEENAFLVPPTALNSDFVPTADLTEQPRVEPRQAANPEEGTRSGDLLLSGIQNCVPSLQPAPFPPPPPPPQDPKVGPKDRKPKEKERERDKERGMDKERKKGKESKSSRSKKAASASHTKTLSSPPDDRPIRSHETAEASALPSPSPPPPPLPPQLQQEPDPSTLPHNSTAAPLVAPVTPPDSSPAKTLSKSRARDVRDHSASWGVWNSAEAPPEARPSASRSPPVRTKSHREDRGERREKKERDQDRERERKIASLENRLPSTKPDARDRSDRREKSKKRELREQSDRRPRQALEPLEPLIKSNVTSPAIPTPPGPAPPHPAPLLRSRSTRNRDETQPTELAKEARERNHARGAERERQSGRTKDTHVDPGSKAVSAEPRRSRSTRQPKTGDMPPQTRTRRHSRRESDYMSGAVGPDEAPIRPQGTQDPVIVDPGVETLESRNLYCEDPSGAFRESVYPPGPDPVFEQSGSRRGIPVDYPFDPQIPPHVPASGSHGRSHDRHGESNIHPTHRPYAEHSGEQHGSLRPSQLDRSRSHRSNRDELPRERPASMLRNKSHQSAPPKQNGAGGGIAGILGMFKLGKSKELPPPPQVSASFSRPQSHIRRSSYAKSPDEEPFDQDARHRRRQSVLRSSDQLDLDPQPYRARSRSRHPEDLGPGVSAEQRHVRQAGNMPPQDKIEKWLRRMPSEPEPVEITPTIIDEPPSATLAGGPKAQGSRPDGRAVDLEDPARTRRRSRQTNRDAGRLAEDPAEQAQLEREERRRLRRERRELELQNQQQARHAQDDTPHRQKSSRRSKPSPPVPGADDPFIDPPRPSTPADDATPRSRPPMQSRRSTRRTSATDPVSGAPTLSDEKRRSRRHREAADDLEDHLDQDEYVDERYHRRRRHRERPPDNGELDGVTPDEPHHLDGRRRSARNKDEETYRERVRGAMREVEANPRQDRAAAYPDERRDRDRNRDRSDRDRDKERNSRYRGPERERNPTRERYGHDEYRPHRERERERGKRYDPGAFDPPKKKTSAGGSGPGIPKEEKKKGGWLSRFI